MEKWLGFKLDSDVAIKVKISLCKRLYSDNTNLVLIFPALEQKERCLQHFHFLNMSSRELFMTTVRLLNLASSFTFLVLTQHNYVVTVITPIESPWQVKHSKQIILLNIHETPRMHPSFYAWGNLSSVILSNLSKGTHNNRRTGTPVQIVHSHSLRSTDSEIRSEENDHILQKQQFRCKELDQKMLGWRKRVKKHENCHGSSHCCCSGVADNLSLGTWCLLHWSNRYPFSLATSNRQADNNCISQQKTSFLWIQENLRILHYYSSLLQIRYLHQLVAPVAWAS